MNAEIITKTNLDGVPDYTLQAFAAKNKNACLLIPIINEADRIIAELTTAQVHGVDRLVDVVLCDGGSTDGSMEPTRLAGLGVNTLLTKTGAGKQGAQLRMGLHFALEAGYEQILTIDGNNKDSIESVPLFLEKLDAGYDIIQGSRFVKGGVAENTPLVRFLAVRLLHAPVISIAARQWFTDTTNAYRGYSRNYLTDPRVQPLRDVFMGYELLAYLSVRATQLGMKGCEVPVRRSYPKTGKTPTKIHGMKGNNDLLRCLFGACFGKFNP